MRSLCDAYTNGIMHNRVCPSNRTSFVSETAELISMQFRLVESKLQVVWRTVYVLLIMVYGVRCTTLEVLQLPFENISIHDEH
jgi:hypothetical protein